LRRYVARAAEEKRAAEEEKWRVQNEEARAAKEARAKEVGTDAS
jgi:hypothetical protein